MDAETDNPETGADAKSQWKLYRDLRRRNERRARIARRAETTRRLRIEQEIDVARQRRFRKTG